MPERDLRTELSKVEAEPLLPIEKKLIGWSLGIGLTLLVILAIVDPFLPVAPSPRRITEMTFLTQSSFRTTGSVILCGSAARYSVDPRGRIRRSYPRKNDLVRR